MFTDKTNNVLIKFQFLFSVLGDPRVNQNPAFLALGILFYRWHNLQASQIQSEHPEWNDEAVFQAARRRVIATLQVRYDLPSYTKLDVLCK